MKKFFLILALAVLPLTGMLAQNTGAIKLFSAEAKAQLDATLCTFLERYLTELNQAATLKDVKFKLTEWNCNLSYDGHEIGSSAFPTVQPVFSQLGASTPFQLKRGTGICEAIWTVGKNNQLKLTFPLNRELIEGTDKVAADNHIFQKLQKALSQNAKPAAKHPAQAEFLEQEHNLYVAEGEIYPANKGLKGHMYYTLKNGKYTPLFNEEYPFFSLTNLFLCYPQADKVKLRLRHLQYGKKKPEINLSVENFCSLFSEKDYKTFCNAGTNKAGDLEIYVIYCHKTLNYIHLLRGTIDKKELFRDKAPVIKADFYSHIPQHNLKSIIQN